MDNLHPLTDEFAIRNWLKFISQTCPGTYHSPRCLIPQFLPKSTMVNVVLHIGVVWRQSICIAKTAPLIFEKGSIDVDMLLVVCCQWMHDRPRKILSIHEQNNPFLVSIVFCSRQPTFCSKQKYLCAISDTARHYVAVTCIYALARLSAVFLLFQCFVYRNEFLFCGVGWQRPINENYFQDSADCSGALLDLRN